MQRAPGASCGTIYGCPAKGAPYTDSLYAAVRRCGIEVREGIWSGRWLFQNLRRGDTLHLHWPSFYYYDPASRPRSLVGLLRFFAISLLLRVRGVRILWTAHNLYPHDGAKGDWMHRLARWFLVRIVDCIFVHGPTAAAIVQREFDVEDELLRVIPHGHWIGQQYPNTVNRAEARRSLGIGHDDYVFLFVGLCKPYKGLESLIEAMGKQPPGATLLIAGKFPSSEYQAFIAELAQRKGGGSVVLHPGYVADDRLQVFLNAADAVVLPYREILTSGAAMLAMSFGRPVIAPRLGSLVDLVDERTGLLYDPEDPLGLQGAMRAARALVFDAADITQHASTFTWEDAAASLADVHRGPAADDPRPAKAANSVAD